MKNLLTTLTVITILLTSSGALHAAPQNDAGAFTGIVTRSGSSEGIPGVKVTLSSGPVDAISLRALSIAGQSVGFYIPAPNPNAPPAAANATGANPSATSPAVQDEQRIFQSVMDAATSEGLSPGSGALTVALNNFRDQTAKFRTITDSGGRFALNGLPPGQYTVRAERDGYFERHGAVATVTIANNQPVNVGLTLIPGATVGGTIRDEDGDPVANANVQIFSVIYPNGFPVLGTAVTAKSNFRGEYRLYWLPAGEYFIGASMEVYATQGARTFYPGVPELTSAIPITLKTGENLDRVDFQMKSPRMVRVSGQVISSAPPPSLPANVQLSAAAAAALASANNMAYIGLLSRNPDVPDPSDNPSVGNISLRPDRGDFNFSAPPGNYDLAGIVPSGGFGRIGLDIADRDLSGITLNIVPAVPVKGSFLLDGPAIDFTKLRLTTMPDNRLAAELGNVGIGAIGGQRSITADGAFTMPLNPGIHVRMSVAALPPGVYVSDVRQDNASVYDSGFDITSATLPLQIVLKSDGGSVKGTILSPSGKPMRNATVVLIPPQARRANRGLYRNTTSDLSGNFTLNGVAPGEYKLFAWVAGYPNGSYFNAKFLARFEDQGHPITVGPSVALTVDGLTIPVD